MEGGARISFFAALIVTVVSQECQYPIKLPDVISVSNRPEHGLPRAQIVLRTPHVVERYLFWASDTKYLTMPEIFMTRPAYYPIYKGVDSIEPVHTQDGDIHTFSLYTPRQVMIHTLSVQIFVGCQTLDLNFPIKPDEIGANLTLPHSLGQIWKIPPLETVYTEDEWVDVKLEYENDMRAQHSEFYFKDDTDQGFRHVDNSNYTDHFIIDEANSGQNMSGSVKKVWARAKAAPGTKELIVSFLMYRFHGDDSLPVHISLFSSFHSNEHSKPFIGVARCTWYKPKGLEENGIKVIPVEAGEEGCVNINAFGNPTSELAVARMTGENQVGDFLHPPGRKYQSRHELMNGNVYHVDGIRADTDEHFVVAAKNAFGSTFVRFKIRGYEPISITSNCSDPKACNNLGVVQIQELDQVVTLTCNIKGPVSRVIFFIAHDYESSNPKALDEISEPLYESTMMPVSGTSRSIIYYLNADQDRIQALGRGADIYCGAYGQYDTKVAKFDVEVNPALLEDSGYNSTSIVYPYK